MSNIEKIQKFIAENQTLLDEGRWVEFYELLRNYEFIGDVSYMLLKSGIDIFSQPNGLTHIPTNYMYKCSQVTEFILPTKYISRVNNEAFYSCQNLKSLDLRGDNSLHSIGSYAFGFCSNLEEIYIPKSLKIVSKSAFTGCDKLKYVYYEGTKEEYQTNLILKLPDNKNSLIIIKCKDGEIEVS